MSQKVHNIASLVLLDNKQRVLLVREAADKPYARSKNLWSFPGGRAKKGENILQSAHRELLEETGHQAQIAALLKIYHWVNKDSSVVFVYTFLAKNPKKVTDKLEKDIRETRWFTPKETFSLFKNKKMRSDIKDLKGYKNGLANKTISLDIFELA